MEREVAPVGGYRLSKKAQSTPPRCVRLIIDQNTPSLPPPPGDQGGFLEIRLKGQFAAKVLQACSG